MEVFAVIFQIISQFTVVTLLLLIASGWTITFDTVPDKDLYIPIGLVVLIVHLMMGGLVFVDRDDIDKHYDFSGVQGFVLVLLRIGIFVMFEVWVIGTRSEAGKKARVFLSVLNFAGSLYMMSFPCLWGISYLMAPYVRHRFIVIGHFAFQIGAMAAMLRQFVSKHSKYYHASSQSKGILPGFKHD